MLCFIKYCSSCLYCQEFVYYCSTAWLTNLFKYLLLACIRLTLYGFASVFTMFHCRGESRCCLQLGFHESYFISVWMFTQVSLRSKIKFLWIHIYTVLKWWQLEVNQTYLIFTQEQMKSKIFIKKAKISSGWGKWGRWLEWWGDDRSM